MTAALLITAALGGLGTVVAGTALATAWWLGRHTPKQPPAPTVEQMAAALHVGDTRAWTRPSMAITATHPLYVRHAEIALSYFPGREATRRG